MAGRHIFDFLLLFFFNIGTVSSGTYYTVVRTCDHAYGTTLATLHSVRSGSSCATQCTKLITCRSGMYNVTSKTCSLNNDTTDLGTLPSDCGIKYLVNQVYLAGSAKFDTSDNITFGSCNTSPDCHINGSVCNVSSCQCDVGLAYIQGDGICTSKTSPCNQSASCVSAVSMSPPYTHEDPTKMTTEMVCSFVLPAGVTYVAGGMLRIAVTTDVPVDIQDHEGRPRIDISDQEVIFTSTYDLWNPIDIYFFVSFYHQITDLPQTECRMILL